MRFGVGHAGVGIGLVVKGGQLDLEAHVGQGFAQLLQRHFSAALDVHAHNRLIAGKGRLGGDLDRLAVGGDGRLGAKGQGHAGHGQQRAKREHLFGHTFSSFD